MMNSRKLLLASSTLLLACLHSSPAASDEVSSQTNREHEPGDHANGHASFKRGCATRDVSDAQRADIDQKIAARGKPRSAAAVAAAAAAAARP